jgi:REP element-mobilizing transposase RayT
MPRRPRVFLEGGIYHVYNRFARGAEIFREGDEAQRFLELLHTARYRDGLTIFSWCLMSNHYHLAIRTGAIPLSRTLGSVQARFGQSYNRRHRSAGPLWQSRFKAKLVEQPRYLDQLVVYIHLNPVTAGVVDDPSGYALSGHRELLRSTPGALIDAEQTLSLFGGSIRTARRRYVRALEGARTVEWRTELPGRLPWWGREPDRPLDPPPPAVWIDEQGLSTAPYRPPVDAEPFLMAAAAGLEMEPKALTAPGSSHAITRLRSLVAALAVERWRLRPVDLAPLFGRRADVVSRWVRWGVEGRQQDTEFKEAYDRLDEVLCSRFDDTPPNPESGAA